MLNTVKSNEIALAADYIRRKSLTDSGVCIIGKSLLCDALKATSEALGEDRTFCRTAGDIPAGCQKLWYLFNVASDAVSDLDAVLSRCASSQIDLIVIILLSNIDQHSVIQQYAEMELIAAHPALAEIRARLTAFCRGGGTVRALFCDCLFGVDSDCFALRAIAREAQENATVTS